MINTPINYCIWLSYFSTDKVAFGDYHLYWPRIKNLYAETTMSKDQGKKQ